MKIAITVNGRAVQAQVTPRTSLADLLREQLLLTGTHTGCEHGICGACTVEIDGEIARSCITYAVTCDGASVRTIEGFDEDALMARLRRAFTESHALQCGYCTPGMLVTARDLVRRKGALSRADIRHQMSGNLCRCTGYTGIVDAIEKVMTENAENGVRPCGSDPRAQRAGLTGWLGPAPGPVAAPGIAREVAHGVRPAGSDPRMPAQEPRSPAPVHVSTGKVEEADGVVRLSQSFMLEHPREAVWALMSDTEAVARCMPGAHLDGPPQDGKVKGRIEVRLGPVAASFAGEGTVTAYPSDFRQVIEGRGIDRKGGSRVSGSVDYRLTETIGSAGPAATRVDVTIGYALTGMLAQVGRSGLARDLAQRIGEAFAQAIDLRLRRGSGSVAPEVRLNAVSLILSAIAARLRAALASVFGSRG